MSTAHACVLGAAPNAVDAAENIFERVLSCAWVSSPMTISQFTWELLSTAKTPKSIQEIQLKQTGRPVLYRS
ncbi:MAG TPA: hypothetical protein VGA12_07260 [Burkholderiales bacterium]